MSQANPARRSRLPCSSVVVKAAFLVCAAGTRAASDLEQPAAIVLETFGGAGELTPRSLETALEVRPGMVLFAGDMLRLRKGFIDLARCKAGIGERIRLRAGAAMLLTQPSETVQGGNFEAEPLGLCRLPNLARTPAPRNFSAFPRGASLGETLDERIVRLPPSPRGEIRRALAGLERLKGNTHALLVSIARAIDLESAGLIGDAVIEYEQILNSWPEADWTRGIIERLREQELAVIGARTGADSRRGRVFAFVVGVSRFRGDGIRQLKHADSDARLFADFLQSERGGSLIQNETLWFLANESATRDRITGELTVFLQGKGNGGNTLILYFATHGAYACAGSNWNSKSPGCRSGKGEDAYILTHDSDPEDLKLTAIRMADLHDLITANASQFGRVLLYLDVCHSGNLGALPLETGLTASRVTSNFDDATGTVGLMLASDRQQPRDSVLEYALEDSRLGGGHGIFTFFVVEGLNGQVAARANNTVELQDLMRHVRESVRDWTAGRQSPVYRSTHENIPVVADASKRGVDLPPFARSMLQKRAAGASPPVARSPEQLLQAPVVMSRIGNEEEGQRTILTYLRGDQLPQERSAFAECARKFGEAIVYAPDATFTESRLLFCQGRSLLFDKEYEQARKLLERSIRLDPGRGYAYNALGIAYLEQAQVSKAARAFRDASRMAPYWAYPVHNLALAHEQAGDYEAAIATYRRAMTLAPSASYHAYNLGLLFQRLNRAEEGRQMYRLAIRNGIAGREGNLPARSPWPNLAEGFNALGTLEAATRNAKGAKENFENALGEDPGLVSAAHNLALLEAEQLRDFGSAEVRWRRILNGPDGAHTVPARLALAGHLAARGRLAEAIGQYELLLGLKPEMTSVRRALAVLFVKTGNIAGAVDVAGKKPDSLLVRTQADLERLQRGEEPEDPELRRIFRQRRSLRSKP